MKITLDGERPFSWNKFWSGLHWAKRSAEKERVLLVVKNAVQLLGWPEVSGPQILTYTSYQKGRIQDPENVCTKPYTDALVKCDVLIDDGPAFIDEVRIRVRRSKRERLVIELSDVIE